MRFLIVEDDSDFRHLVAEVALEHCDALDLVFAHDGQEAIEILQNDHSFDLIVSDFFMPRVNGEGLYRFAVDQHLKIPFVLYTSAPIVDWAAFKACGPFAGYVPKHNLQHLRALISKVVSETPSVPTIAPNAPYL